MVTRLGMVPAALCIVAAALLGGWGWSAHQESRDQAREEAARREAAEPQIDLPLGMEPSVDPVKMICGVLIEASVLQMPIDAGPMFDEPGAGPATTLAPSSIDTAWALVSIMNEDLLVGTDLDQPELRDAVGGLGRAVTDAVTRTDEPLADPEVISAAAHLRETLEGPCL